MGLGYQKYRWFQGILFFPLEETRVLKNSNVYLLPTVNKGHEHILNFIIQVCLNYS